MIAPALREWNANLAHVARVTVLCNSYSQVAQSKFGSVPRGL